MRLEGNVSATARDDVLVVGGGAIGMAIAESLACEGLRVRVLEAEGVASGASGAGAGMLAPISEASQDGPLLRLGLESLTRFGPFCSRLASETGIDPEFEESGLLRLARSESERAALEAMPGRLIGDGSTREWAVNPILEWVGAGTLRSDEPCIGEEVLGALHSPLECHLRPPVLVRALEASARARGVKIETGVRATLLRRESGRVVGVESSAGRRDAGRVVVAAGAWSPGLLEASSISSRSGGNLAIEPVRGQMLFLAPPLPPARSIIWSDGVYFVPKRDGSWVVGATEERVGFDCRVTAQGIGWLLERARSVFPVLAEASFVRAWAGLRPVSRDGIPWIGPVPGWENLCLAAGHGRNGVLLAPITAELIRDDLLGKVGSLLAEAVAPARAFDA
ncbi:MAG: glycine oxidase ThiO [bacterium]|nr:glycine oxidase ThiO [Deltaproteobacteria bacterium]MCP4906572.1 glycine oxidase ThiO [bacterium]